MGAVGGVSHITSYENLINWELVAPTFASAHFFDPSNHTALALHNIHNVKAKGGVNMGVSCAGYGLGPVGVGPVGVGPIGASCGGYGLGTTTGVILVLFILLVIISRTFI
jgi:hypothetical protein